MKNISVELYQKLDGLLEEPVEVLFWEQVYEFVVMSYHLSSEHRFSVSELFYELKKRGIEQTADVVKFYAHGMFLLAKYHGLEIYGAGFYI